ncbi:MAG: MBL fold metallo-hydrolase [Microvirga sp.]|nr:MBL fold metallo-hydrolase [Microvirga sp.]
MIKQNRRELLALSGLSLAALAGGAGLGFGVTPARAQGARSFADIGGAYRYAVGDIDVVAMLEGVRGGPLQDGFVANAPIEEVRAALAAAQRPEDTLENPFTVTLIRTGDRLVLIDTGFGPGADAPLGRLVPGLAAIGVQPGDIDMVIISHFHGDHISGLKDANGAPIYPNAEVLAPQAEMDFWLDEGEASRAPENRRGGFAAAQRIFAQGGPGALSVRPYGDGDELAPGIVAVAAYGHAPGHMAFRVHSGDAQLLLVSDAAHLPFLFVRNPGWSVMFDMDREMAVETRIRLLDMAAADRMLVAGYHWGFPNVGHVRRDGEGFDFERLPWPT